MEFKKFINESAEKTATFAFGRFNPPTVGHEKLIQKVSDVANEHGGSAHVVASHSEGESKNPLPQKAKIGYLKKVSPKGVTVSGSTKEEPTFLHAAAKLHAAGHKHLVMVAGSDRKDHYEKLLNQYNNVAGKHGHYNFKSIKVVSSGERDPDSEGVEGMSGTKMRAHARAGEMKDFKSGLPKALHPQATEIANHIKSVKEEVDETRESYIAGDIYNVGDIVESNTGEVGEIVYRGSSYVTIQLETGNTTKHWLKDIKESNKTVNISPAVRNVKGRQIPALFLPKEAHHWENQLMVPEITSATSIRNEGFATSYIPTANKKAPILGADGKYYSPPAGHIVTTGKTPDMNDLTRAYGNKDPNSKLIKKQAQLAKAAEVPTEVPIRTNPMATESIRQNFPQTRLRSAGQTLKRGLKTMNKTIRKPMGEDISGAIIPPYGIQTPKVSTAHRDINYTSNKNVSHGIDNTYANQGYADKPLGLVSFKTFAADPDMQGIKAVADLTKEIDTVDQERLAHQKSPAYELMRKSKLQGMT